MRVRSSFWWGVWVLGLLSASACGTEGSGGSGADVPLKGEKAALVVKAAEGGEVLIKDLSLKVPAGALDKDTEITVEVEDTSGVPAADEVVGPVYNFGPDGTQFKKAVTLELPLARLPGSKEKAHVAWLDEESGQWVKLADSKRSGDKVVATAMHFTRFTITFEVTSSGDVAQTGGMCTDDFSPCGGDPEGTWSFRAACFTLTDFGDIGGEDCSGATSTVDVDISGTITFNDGAITGEQSMTVEVRASLPKSCLPEGASCRELDATDAGDACEFVDASGPEQETIEETYTVEGTTLVFSDGTAAGFCVQGDTLTVRVLDDLDGNEVQYTATRR